MLHHNPKWPETLILTHTDTRRVAHPTETRRVAPPQEPESVPDPAGHRSTAYNFDFTKDAAWSGTYLNSSRGGRW